MEEGPATSGKRTACSLVTINVNEGLHDWQRQLGKLVLGEVAENCLEVKAP